MKNKIFRNLGYKILALVVAVVLWFLIMTVADPTATRTIMNIPISIINDDTLRSATKTYSVTGTQRATVVVEGPSSIVNRLTADDFTAVADIAQMYDVTGRVPVRVSCTANGINDSQLRLQTSSIQINIEDILTKNIQLKLEHTGDLADGYLLGRMTASPRFVTVTAPESVIERIASAVVTVDLANMAERFDYSADIEFRTESGTPLHLETLAETSVSTTSATVTVEVLSVSTVPIAISVIGQTEVADGYRYTGYKQSKSSVVVSGLKSSLATLSSIIISGETLSVAGASEDVTYSVNLGDYLPDGISLLSAEDATLEVTLYIEEMVTKSFDLLSRLRLLNRVTGYEYTTLSRTLNVNIRALEDDFKDFDPTQVSVSIDVGELETGGVYELPVTVTSYGPFEQVGTVLVRIQIEDPSATEPSTEGSTEETAP